MLLHLSIQYSIDACQKFEAKVESIMEVHI